MVVLLFSCIIGVFSRLLSFVSNKTTGTVCYMPFRKERHFLMETGNYCENCKHFLKYYTIFMGTRLRYSDCGHCKHEKINKKIEREVIYNKQPCEYFEQAESAVSREKLEKVITEMKERLDEIALLLNLD